MEDNIFPLKSKGTHLMGQCPVHLLKVNDTVPLHFLSLVPLCQATLRTYICLILYFK